VLKALEAGDPLAESVAAFVTAARSGQPPLVRPRQARRALETALMIDEASERSGALRSQQELVAYAAAN
jgi:predicted dehydrogenase